MITHKIVAPLSALAILASSATAAKKPAAQPQVQLSEAGKQLEAKYDAMLKSLRDEISRSIPKLDSQTASGILKARDGVSKAADGASKAQDPANKVKTAQALVEHAKGKWIGGAEKGIAQAQAALKKATTDAQKKAADADLAKWQANKEDGLKALKERQAALEKAKEELAKVGQAGEAAKTALAQARSAESNASSSLLKTLDPFLSSDKLDSKLIKATVLTEATPRGLAEFAQHGREQESLVERLLADEKLMREMLVNGSANYGKYGRAMQIYDAILKASPKAKEGVPQRLALAVALEFAVPVKQSNAESQTSAPAEVDPVKRYLHYENAYLNGELDPAFKSLNVWELRMAVDCDAPDEILAWGREMLRTYRPDHIYNANYGWRYVASVKTEVPYGSQNVQFDSPALHNYQNIIKDGGICGRRAFFGRFILRSFGIPVWGVTQHKHAALSHWTPKGWVINLGAGFEHSWWDKDEVSRSGSDFLAEAQAREHEKDFIKVLRAKWVSKVLGEQPYNDRKKEKTEPGPWSLAAHYQTLALASKAVTLGPLGQELAEANEPKDKEPEEQASVSKEDQQHGTGKNGALIIPAVALTKPAGKVIVMKSFNGGMQIHASGGFKTQYEFDAPKAGKYTLTACVATAQEGQKFIFSDNNSAKPIETPVPYTVGLWQQTKPVELTLKQGKNVLNFEIKQDSRGVTIKEFTLCPI